MVNGFTEIKRHPNEKNASSDHDSIHRHRHLNETECSVIARYRQFNFDILQNYSSRFRFLNVCSGVTDTVSAGAETTPKFSICFFTWSVQRFDRSQRSRIARDRGRRRYFVRFLTEALVFFFFFRDRIGISSYSPEMTGGTYGIFLASWVRILLATDHSMMNAWSNDSQPNKWPVSIRWTNC